MHAAGASGGGAGGTPLGGSGGAPLRTRCTLSQEDPRVEGIRPDEIATLDGAQFVEGDVRSYHWVLKEEDCDAVVPNAQYQLKGENSQFVQFQPSRPAPYHFTLEVTGPRGDRASCELEVPVEGVGLRVELCWDTSTSTDLDLYLHTPFDQAPWFEPSAGDVMSGINATTCNTSNCAAELRELPRVDWGYSDSPREACNTPSFEGFSAVGSCPNPRAADDNNQRIANGTTERLQLDNPRERERFRVMVQNFDNRPARPHVFIYCSGQRAAALDPPQSPPNFVSPFRAGFGVMWRAADVTTAVDPEGRTACSVESVSDAITENDPRF